MPKLLSAQELLQEAKTWSPPGGRSNRSPADRLKPAVDALLGRGWTGAQILRAFKAAGQIPQKDAEAVRSAVYRYIRSKRNSNSHP